MFCARPGERLRDGQLIAQVIDPLSDRVTPIYSATQGVLYARSLRRMATAGMVIAHVAGAGEHRSEYLLSP